MKIHLLTLLSIFILASSAQAVRAQTIDDQVEELLGKMTVKEKIGQMTQLNIGTLNPTGQHDDVLLNSEKFIPLIRDYAVGSFLNGESVPHEQWFKFMDDMTRLSVEHSRLEIPIIFGIDHMHGASYLLNSTMFPHNINLGATFDPEHVKNQGYVTSMESAGFSHHWIFSPVLDIGVSPLWPRFYETFGEDPYVAEVMGPVLVHAIQDNPDIAPYKQAATGKHFLGYSAPYAGWDRTPAHIPDQQLYEFFVPPFKAAVDAGVKTIMINSAEINGIPVHASKEILTDLLRGYMGFEGVVITDWADIIQLVKKHRVAENIKEATLIAINAGIDMSMTPSDLSFNEAMMELVEEGRVSEERIDESVRRILRLKFELNLFDNPYPTREFFDLIGSDKHRQLAYNAAVESIVVLKNEGNLLPITTKPNKILVVGPTADSKRNLNGGWSLTWQGGRDEQYPEEMETVYSALKKNFPQSDIRLFGTLDNSSIESIKEQASSADMIVYVLGEKPYAEGVGNINDLYLDKKQYEVVEITANSKAKKVLVMVEGRPRIITDIVDSMDAVLFAGLPGNEGADAIVNIITGKETPSGKLPFTYPRYSGTHFPYNHKVAVFTPSNQAQEEFVETSLYPFGVGLTYTTFDYSDLEISSTEGDQKTTFKATVRVTNTGSLTAKESVLWFLSDHVATITRPVKELRHFEKVELEPGETTTLSFEIVPTKDLSFPNKNGGLLLENGSFSVSVGDESLTFTLID